MFREELRDAVRESGAVVRAASPIHRKLRGRIMVALALTVVVDVVGSAMIWAVERGAPGTGIHTVGDAVFWTSSQLLTISSSLPNPISAVGRIIDVVLELYAITVVTAMAGSFGAFFVHRAQQQGASS